MGVNLELLERYRRFEDRGAGFSEEFIQPAIGSGRTVAALSRPLGPASDVGFVICPSFGMEQIHLLRLETVIARQLAGAGFTVLRFHGQGYGDSDGNASDARLSTHLTDATEAVELLAGQPGIGRVGVLGARIGGMVAALVADRNDLPYMALWEPVVIGSEYVRGVLRSQLLHSVVQEAQSRGHEQPGKSASNVTELRSTMVEQGWVEIRGFPLSLAAYEEFSAVNLVKDLQRFQGTALIVSVSRTGGATAGTSRLSERLRQLGATCDLAVLQDRSAAQFGFHHHANIPDGIKVDLQFGLGRRLAEATTSWAVERVGGSEGAAGADGERARSR